MWSLTVMNTEIHHMTLKPPLSGVFSSSLCWFWFYIPCFQLHSNNNCSFLHSLKKATFVSWAQHKVKYLVSTEQTLPSRIAGIQNKVYFSTECQLWIFVGSLQVHHCALESHMYVAPLAQPQTKRSCICKGSSL